MEDKGWGDEELIDVIIDIVEHAEKETKMGEMVPDYKTRLAAWDRMAEMRGLVSKKTDPLGSAPGTVNLALLLQSSKN